MLWAISGRTPTSSTRAPSRPAARAVCTSALATKLSTTETAVMSSKTHVARAVLTPCSTRSVICAARPSSIAPTSGTRITPGSSGITGLPSSRMVSPSARSRRSVASRLA
jgi:hypothetical protein